MTEHALTTPSLPGLRSLCDALAGGELSATTLAVSAVQAAQRLNPLLHFYISDTFDEVLHSAHLADQRRQAGQSLGVLDGIPYVAKDVFHRQGVRTTAGSRVLADAVADSDAQLISELRARGAGLLAKTNLHEFCYGAAGTNPWYGTAVNPRAPQRMVGGSSSGSAVAVAAGIVPFALGTDTGGSVRVPAALCGITGFKPSFAALSLEGVIPFCWSLDHAGLLTHSADDAALLFEELSGTCAAVPPLAGLRVGVINAWEQRCAPDVANALQALCERLGTQGACFKEIQLPDLDETRTVSLALQLTEGLAWHGPLLAHSKALYGDDIRSGLAMGQFVTAESYIQCQRALSLYRMQFQRLFSEIDVLLLPATPVTAPAVGTTSVQVAGQTMSVGNALTLFTSFFNLVGAPAIVLPSGSDRDGLPTSVQLVAKAGADATLLAIARAVERSIDVTP